MRPRGMRRSALSRREAAPILYGSAANAMAFRDGGATHAPPFKYAATTAKQAIKSFTPASKYAATTAKEAIKSFTPTSWEAEASGWKKYMQDPVYRKQTRMQTAGLPAAASPFAAMSQVPIATKDKNKAPPPRMKTGMTGAR